MRSGSPRWARTKVSARETSGVEAALGAHGIRHTAEGLWDGAKKIYEGAKKLVTGGDGTEAAKPAGDIDYRPKKPAEVLIN